MDRSSKTDSIISILATFMANFIYNDLYTAAKSSSDNSNESITNQYLKISRDFLQGIKGDKNKIVKFITQICEYFRKNTSMSTISYGDFINEIVKFSVPNAYFDDLKNTDKDAIMIQLIYHTISNAILYALEQQIKNIIDDRDKEQSQIGIRILTEKCNQIINNKRSELYSKFIGDSKEASRLANTYEKDTLLAALEKVIRENKKLKEQLEEDVNLEIDRAEKYKKRYLKLKEDYEQLEAQLNTRRTRKPKTVQQDIIPQKTVKFVPSMHEDSFDIRTDNVAQRQPSPEFAKKSVSFSDDDIKSEEDDVLPF